jgi:hypothetical protein
MSRAKLGSARSAAWEGSRCSASTLLLGVRNVMRVCCIHYEPEKQRDVSTDQQIAGQTRDLLRNKVPLAFWEKSMGVTMDSKKGRVESQGMVSG